MPWYKLNCSLLGYELSFKIQGLRISRISNSVDFKGVESLK